MSSFRVFSLKIGAGGGAATLRRFAAPLGLKSWPSCLGSRRSLLRRNLRLRLLLIIIDYYSRLNY